MTFHINSFLGVINKEVDLSQEEDTASSQSWEDILFELTGIDLRICPKCKKGHKIRKEIIPRSIHAPP